jgi:hypothetical protein
LIRGGLGLVLFIAGLVVMLFFGNNVTLTCVRSLPPPGFCTLRSANMVSARETIIPIPDLSGAAIDVSQGEDGDTYRVLLQTTRGSLPMTSYYSSGLSAKQQAVDQVNSFLIYDTMQTLSIKTDDRIWIAIFSGIFAGSGALLLILAVLKIIQDTRAGGLETA